MNKQTSFLITAAILVAAVATVALYTVNAASKARIPNRPVDCGVENVPDSTLFL